MISVDNTKYVKNTEKPSEPLILYSTREVRKLDPPKIPIGLGMMLIEGHSSVKALLPGN